jgi:hypothetical protein
LSALADLRGLLERLGRRLSVVEPGDDAAFVALRARVVRLMGAIPEMVDALIGALNHLDRHSGAMICDCTRCEALRPVTAPIRAALDKAGVPFRRPAPDAVLITTRMDIVRELADAARDYSAAHGCTDPSCYTCKRLDAAILAAKDLRNA